MPLRLEESRGIAASIMIAFNETRVWDTSTWISITTPNSRRANPHGDQSYPPLVPVCYSRRSRGLGCRCSCAGRCLGGCPGPRHISERISQIVPKEVAPIGLRRHKMASLVVLDTLVARKFHKHVGSLRNDDNVCFAEDVQGRRGVRWKEDAVT